VEHPQGTTVLVLGILSLAVCGILGPFAWNMGNKALREIDANTGVTYRNRGNVTAGRLCGMIGCAMLVLQVLLVIVWLIAVADIRDGI
jgi:TRAP-type C4-dicarboxylate transport system permease small subunit